MQKPGKDQTKVPVAGGEASFTTDSGENSSLGSCSLGKMCTVSFTQSQVDAAVLKYMYRSHINSTAYITWLRTI